MEVCLCGCASPSHITCCNLFCVLTVTVRVRVRVWAGVLCYFRECLTLVGPEGIAKEEAEADVQKEEKTAKAGEGVPLRMCLTLSQWVRVGVRVRVKVWVRVGCGQVCFAVSKCA